MTASKRSTKSDAYGISHCGGVSRDEVRERRLVVDLEQAYTVTLEEDHFH